MIVWSGHGYLVAIYVFVMSLVTEFAIEAIMKDDSYYQDAGWPIALALIIAGALSWATGSALKKAGDDSDSPRSHSLFFVPMQWWGPVLAVIAIAVFISRAR